MEMCKICDTPKTVVDGQVKYIIDDEHGVRTAPCGRCTEELMHNNKMDS